MRVLKVYYWLSGGYKCKRIPLIRLKGKWLEKAGFTVGDHIEVTITEEKLIITKI